MDPRLTALGRTPPPEPLGLVTDLLDTWFGRTADGVGEDALRTPADLAAWCRARGAEVADAAVGSDDLDLARAIRAGLRTELARHTDPALAVDAEAVERFDDAAAGLGLRVRADPFRLEPDEERAARRVLATVVAAPMAVDERTWARLKACRDPLCRTAFYDGSRNGSGVWCSMSACGAAAKQRAFVERRRVKRAGERGFS
ncbi:CGNR zinc finger domain-containing protein [Actinomycetospora sp. NBC_00405]|uniref:CGNR zinc finger domain-containing protein n=1 Tax=Actinomycetospora sp. NBC_00405 TaxID=2975952 RepID=UPI002E1DD2A0